MAKRDQLSRRAACVRLGALTAATCGLSFGAGAQEYHPQDQLHLSKAAARYQDQPSGAESCGSCPYFIAPNGCAVVKGEISPNGWCPMYTQFSALDRGAHL